MSAAQNHTDRVAVTIITGFLGAGKTTLIRKLLQESGKKHRIAVIVNEFGDLGVDQEILRQCPKAGCAADSIVELANGCICCTVADDFLPMMQQLLAGKNRPEHIVIETSGLALPEPLVRALAWPEVRADTRLNGVIALADAVALGEGRFAADEGAIEQQRAADQTLEHATALADLFADQMKFADLILLSKCDLVRASQRERAREIIGRYARKGAPLLEVTQGDIAPDILLGLLEIDTDTEAIAAGEHEHEHEHDHDHEQFSTVSIELPLCPDQQWLIDRVSRMIAEFSLLRVKGFAAIAGKKMPLLIQAVGPRVQIEFVTDIAPAGRLVAIGRDGLDPLTLARFFAVDESLMQRDASLTH